jgi:archaellum component FlaC
MLEEGTISIQDSVQYLKTENDELASKLAKSERNVEKCRDEITRLRNEAKDFRVDLQTFSSETAQLKTSTNVAVGIELNTMRKDVPEFTQHVRVIATNLHPLSGRVETVELRAVENVDSNFTELHKDQLEKLAFELYDPCGLFPKLEHDLSLISNKLESGGGIHCNGNYVSHDKEAAQWFVDHKATICIMEDAVSILHAIGATVFHTSEATHTREAAKKIDLASDLEASIRDSFSTTVPSILVGNKKETMSGAFECLIGYLKDYTVWHPRGTKASSGIKTRIRDGVKTVMGRNSVTKYYELKELASSMATDSQSFITELLECVTT